MNDETTSPNLQSSKDALSFGFLFSIVIRSLIWIALLVMVPFLLLPRCLRMFEEFGIALPKLTQSTFVVGDIISSVGFFYVIVAITAIVAWQLVLFSLNERRIGSKLVFADWILISIATAIVAISLGMPIAAIVSGLNS